MKVFSSGESCCSIATGRTFVIGRIACVCTMALFRACKIGREMMPSVCVEPLFLLKPLSLRESKSVCL